MAKSQAGDVILKRLLCLFAILAVNGCEDLPLPQIAGAPKPVMSRENYDATVEELTELRKQLQDAMMGDGPTPEEWKPHGEEIEEKTSAIIKRIGKDETVNARTMRRSADTIATISSLLGSSPETGRDEAIQRLKTSLDADLARPYEEVAAAVPVADNQPLFLTDADYRAMLDELTELREQLIAAMEGDGPTPEEWQPKGAEIAKKVAAIHKGVVKNKSDKARRVRRAADMIGVISSLLATPADTTRNENIQVLDASLADTMATLRQQLSPE